MNKTKLQSAFATFLRAVADALDTPASLTPPQLVPEEPESEKPKRGRRPKEVTVDSQGTNVAQQPTSEETEEITHAFLMDHIKPIVTGTDEGKKVRLKAAIKQYGKTISTVEPKDLAALKVDIDVILAEE